MEKQINSLKTRIEKMQEMFNKDLEEIKKHQYIIKNAINGIKNTLEGTNRRITEAENIQQVKEHDKCPLNQTKKEEIGSLPEKELRMMIVKMIQNLESKMELQMNRLETKIEKMHEMFNKDLEEIKKS